MCSKNQGFYNSDDIATTINNLAIEIHKQNCDVGWWDNPNRDIFETLMLVVTEIAEAVEGERKNLMDDHLPQRKMAEVELADTLIRLLDLAGKHNWGYVENEKVIQVCREDLSQAKSIGAKYLILTARVVQLANYYEQSNLLMIIDLYVQTVQMVIELAAERGYQLLPAVHDKLEYNRHRLDHKRENREKENGKKF